MEEVAAAEVIVSPNIWTQPDVYELENRGVDPDGVIWAAIEALATLQGARVLDVGCGSGFHLPFFAERAASVIGLEPHPPLLARAQRRVRELGLGTVDARAGTAQVMPVASNSVDVLHARWAYFFGPGCEPGLREVQRVLAPGGTAFVIDNDATTSTFGRWFTRAWPDYDPNAVERFWHRHGWSRTAVAMRWQFQTRADFEAVVGIEFSAQMARVIVSEHPGTGVDYAVNLWRYTKPVVGADA